MPVEQEPPTSSGNGPEAAAFTNGGEWTFTAHASFG